MARRPTLTNEALAKLGAEKLAQLVFDEAGRSAPFKKLVMAALAGTKGPSAVAAIVDRRLAGLERARGFVDWEKRKAFAADLKATVAIIAGELGPADPAAAIDRLLRFLACAGTVFDRVDDSSGHVQGVFEDAAEALPALAANVPDKAKIDLALRLVPLVVEDGYGLVETAFQATLPLLPPACLGDIDAKLARAVTKENGSPRGEAQQDWARVVSRSRLIRARQAIADITGDVDRFIALGGGLAGGRQDNAQVAERLLKAGRAAEALDWIRRPSRPGLRIATMADIADESTGTDLRDRQRVPLEVRILMALGQKDAAQDVRWLAFEANLDDEILRDYIAHLPDFEEFDALARAFACAKAHPRRYRALDFLVTWPRLDLAAQFVIDHREDWAGRHYDALVAAAETLEHDHSVAATILYRALLDDILARARSAAYGHGARYLARLDDLAPEGAAAAGLIDHDAYRAGLRRAHGRKAGFWSIVDGAR